MMEIHVLASGSKGNSTLLIIDNLHILVDVGISYTHLKKALEKLNIEHLDLVLITHEHQDHIKGLEQLIKKRNVKVCGAPLRKVLPSYEVMGDKMVFKGLEIEAFSVSHDCLTTFGYIIHADKKIAYVTDCGYLDAEILKKLNGCNIILMEANHDVEMLINNKNYTWNLKQRIIGDSGHLSNIQFFQYLRKLQHDKLEVVVALHLSEENNRFDLVQNLFDDLDLGEIGFVAQQHEILNIKL